MRQFHTIILFSFIFFSPLLCQDKITIDRVNSKFKALEFENVIDMVDSLLILNPGMDDESKINLFVWKGVSHYSLGDKDKTRKCFIEILKRDREYLLDPVIISPKIINYYNLVREEFLDIAPSLATETEADSAFAETQPAPLKINAAMHKNAVVRSLILPGWGHLYTDQTMKGLILTTAGAASAASMIYFIFDTNSKEKDYLNAADPVIIKQKYDDYNTSYKLRNAAIISFAVVWLYSQIDMLFFSDEHLTETPAVEITTNNFTRHRQQLNLSLRIAL